MTYAFDDEFHFFVRKLVASHFPNHLAEVVVTEVVITVEICKDPS